MPQPHINNPYGTDWTTLKVVQGRVDPRDFSYLEGLFPFVTGLQDKIVSNLYHKLVNEFKLRAAAYESTHGKPLESAWALDSTAYDILKDIMADCNFGGCSPSGREDGPRNVGRRAGGVHAAGGTTPNVSANPKGGASPRGRKPRGKKEVQKGGGVSRPDSQATGNPGVVTAADLLNQINNL